MADADPACPGSAVVATEGQVEIILDHLGFWCRCTATGCTWVSDPGTSTGRYASRSSARRAARRHLAPEETS